MANLHAARHALPVVLALEEELVRKCMANEIKVGKNESIDSALRRFKRMSQKAGTLAEVRKREHYEKPSVRRKKKSEAARKRKYRG